MPRVKEIFVVVQVTVIAPNLASSVAVVNGRYTIALRALRDIMPGEELTQDYKLCYRFTRRI